MEASMENERSAEEKKEIVIPCGHLPWDDWKLAKRVVLFHVEYVELERVIDCESKSGSCTSYPKRQRRSSTDYCEMEEDTCNPVDCQECKANIIHYLTNVISHPHPNRVMSDLCTRFYDYLHDGTHPSSKVIPFCCWARLAEKDLKPTRNLFTLRYIRTRATHTCLNQLSYLCDDTCLNTDTKEYPVLEDVCYQIQNNIERHCLSRLGNDKPEWRVSWVGIHTPRPNHPRLCHLNLTKVDQQNQDVMAFTCPICFQGQVQEELEDNTKRKRVNDSTAAINKKKRSRLEDIVRLPCQHIYHESCINQWLQNACRDTCPTCRFKLLDAPVCNAWGTRQVSSLGDLTVFKHIHKPPSNTKLARFMLSKGIKYK